MARRTSPRAATSIFSIFGECSGNVRSTPTPKDCLRTVKVSRSAVALALDDDALEDLGAAARALDDLEVDADAVAGVELRDAAQLGALEAFDDGAHGKEKAREDRGRASPARRRLMVARPGGSRAPRSRLRARRHWRISSWCPDSSTSGTRQPRYSAGRV